MRVGVTGSRYGPITDAQSDSMKRVIKGLKGKENTFYHGACIGVDEEATMMAHELGYTCVAFPPLNKRFVSEAALTLSIEIRPEKEYLARDRDIAQECEVLVVVPSTFKVHPHSGTWYTSFYAKTIGRRRIIVYPDGSTKEK